MITIILYYLAVFGVWDVPPTKEGIIHIWTVGITADICTVLVLILVNYLVYRHNQKRQEGF